MFVPKSGRLVSQYNGSLLFLNLVGLFSQNETGYLENRPMTMPSCSNTIRAAMMAAPEDDLVERHQCRKLTASFVGVGVVGAQ